MVMDDPVQKIPTTLVTADSTGAPDEGGQGGHGFPDLTGIEKRPKAEKDNVQLPLRQWGAGNGYLLVLSKAKW